MASRVAGVCSTSLPTDAPYFTTEIRYDNVLIGDYQQINGKTIPTFNPATHKMMKLFNDTHFAFVSHGDKRPTERTRNARARAKRLALVLRHAVTQRLALRLGSGGLVRATRISQKLYEAQHGLLVRSETVEEPNAGDGRPDRPLPDGLPGAFVGCGVGQPPGRGRR